METVEELEQKLESHKLTISLVFLVSIQEVVLSHKNEELLNKLLPPNDSRFHGKATCYANTRDAILNKINSWIEKHATDSHTPTDTPSSRLFWLYGVAGCGKSTIAASVCHIQYSRLVGSFFCKRDQDERRDGVRLFWAIAYYLARANATYRDRLLAVLQQDDTLIDRDLNTQVDRILIRPLAISECNELAPPALIVIDALDECTNSDMVANNLARVLKVTSRVHFLITSRDQPGIRQGLFNELDAAKEQHNLFDYDAHDDIETYIRSQFLQAKLHVDAHKEEIAALVKKSQGLFIWIHTTMQLIMTSTGKLAALKRMIEFGGDTSTLYDIYHMVLENASRNSMTDEHIIRHIVGLIRVTSAISLLYPVALPPSSCDLQLHGL